MTLDNWAHLAEALTIAGMAWKVNRALNKFIDALHNFPLHRHVNGHILYPDGYKPPVIEDFPSGRSAPASQRSG